MSKPLTVTPLAVREVIVPNAVIFGCSGLLTVLASETSPTTLAPVKFVNKLPLPIIKLPVTLPLATTPPAVVKLPPVTLPVVTTLPPRTLID